MYLKEYKALLNEIRSLKSNQTFFQIVIKKNKSFIIELNKVLEKIKILKSLTKTEFDLFNDIQWVIESEIFFKSKRIRNFLEKNKISFSQKSVIFVRYFLYTIESINYLESRGRDSFGISINFISKNSIKIKKTNFINQKYFNFFQKKLSSGNYLINFTFKYAKRIGYSGENTIKILSLINSKKILKKIDFNFLESFDLIAHTRWASVGEVNISNTHPVIEKKSNIINLSFMNGDINNYIDLKKKLIRRKKFFFSDKKCTNDLQPLPSLIFENKYKINDILNGSYVIFNYNSKNPRKISIFKKGSQGLYYTIDEDSNLHIASDVYGLINRSNKFKKLGNDGTFIVDKKFIKKEKKKNFFKTDLMTNDLSKKGFERFFLKEINDTEIFLKRTVNNYINFNKSIFTNINKILDFKTLNFLKQKKIKNIIFTGMGSCYSAAVGISKYLSQRLNSIDFKNIKIEATIASEGSGFYLSEKMEDTIIVVIAQSGTTIDTNIFAKMAKERGAYTMALVNKKQGDVTYIVDKSLYLGNGRDIEMSVPSTKTYTCHLVIGFILSEKIISILQKKNNSRFFKTLKELVSSNFIFNTLNKLKKEINTIQVNVFKYQNWVVVYDDSENSYSALELRIKLSECCYKSIPYLHINTFNKLNLKNSLVFYVGKNKPNFKEINNKNYYIFLTKDFSKKKINNLSCINFKSKDFIKLIIETSLGMQLLAYRMSEIIDKSSNEINKTNRNIKSIIKFIVDKKNTSQFQLMSFKNKRKFLSEKLKRPIDAIKHQAKTVTVGATRSIHDNIIFLDDQYENTFDKKININFENKFMILKKNINIIGNEFSDTEKYFFGNLIEYYNFKYKDTKHYKLYNEKKFLDINRKNNSNIFFDKRNNKILCNKKNIFNQKSFDSHNLIKTFLPLDNLSLKNEILFNNAKKVMTDNNFYYQINFEKLFDKFNNIKFLGSGINYLVAKKYSQFFSKKYNRSIAFDVIENHKHIDISSESLVLILAANINRSGFQNDIYSEVEKFIAHDNEPIIFTNLENNMFDQILFQKSYNKKRIIKLPWVEEIYSLSIFDFYFQNFIS